MFARLDEARCHDEDFRVADGLAGAFFRVQVPGLLCAVKQDIGQDSRSMALAEARQGTDLGRFAQLLASAPAVPAPDSGVRRLRFGLKVFRFGSCVVPVP